MNLYEIKTDRVSSFDKLHLFLKYYDISHQKFNLEYYCEDSSYAFSNNDFGVWCGRDCISFNLNELPLELESEFNSNPIIYYFGNIKVYVNIGKEIISKERIIDDQNQYNMESVQQLIEYLDEIRRH